MTESMEFIFAKAKGLALDGRWQEIIDLLSASPGLATFTDEHGQNLFHIVAGMDGAVAAIQALIDLNVEVNRQDNSGATPLGNAIHGGHRYGIDTDANVELLIGAGADLSQFDETGNPPLHAALYERRPTVVSLLLTAGADPLQANAYGDDAYAQADWLKDAEMKSLLPPKHPLTGDPR